MFYRIFVHCVGPRQYVLYVDSFIKTTIFGEVESVSVYHATCHCRMRWRKHPIHYWEQTKQTRSKKVETFTLNPYLPEDSFIFIGLAVNWLKMNGHGSFKNPEKSAASARKSFLGILNRHDVKHWKIFAGFKKTSKKKQILMHGKIIEHFEGEGECMTHSLIIPLVHLKSLVIPLFHLKKKY